MGLADVVRQINEFELAVARIEASAVEDPLPPIYRDHEELPIAVSDQATTSYREDEELPEGAHSQCKPRNSDTSSKTCPSTLYWLNTASTRGTFSAR